MMQNPNRMNTALSLKNLSPLPNLLSGFSPWEAELQEKTGTLEAQG